MDENGIDCGLLELIGLVNGLCVWCQFFLCKIKNSLTQLKIIYLQKSNKQIQINLISQIFVDGSTNFDLVLIQSKYSFIDWIMRFTPHYN